MIVMRIQFRCDHVDCPSNDEYSADIDFNSPLRMPILPPGWLSISNDLKDTKIYCREHEIIIGNMKIL